MAEKKYRWMFNPAVTSPNPNPMFRRSCNAAAINHPNITKKSTNAQWRR
jgi:hypothetical protein